jgi:hypothetical protein
MTEDSEQTLVAGESVYFQVIDRVAAEVLETMFFTEAVAGGCDHASSPPDISVRIDFEGSHAGEFVLGVPLSAARPIAAAFLGLAEDEIAEKECNQVIFELANILCGAVLSNRWPDSRLSLAMPELVAGGPPREGALHRCFTLPEGVLALTIACANEPERKN